MDGGRLGAIKCIAFLESIGVVHQAVEQGVAHRIRFRLCEATGQVCEVIVFGGELLLESTKIRQRELYGT